MANGQRKIILIGYRGTGKSTVGRAVAQKLGLPFLDMDQALEEEAGCTIGEMVAAAGWDVFREREHRLLAALAERPAMVLATGGGAVLHQELWPRLKAENLVVWLTADTATIGRRLGSDAKSTAQRPSLTGQDIRTEIAAVLAEREPLYRQSATLAIDTTTTPVAEAAARIAAAYRQATEH